MRKHRRGGRCVPSFLDAMSMLTVVFEQALLWRWELEAIQRAQVAARRVATGKHVAWCREICAGLPLGLGCNAQVEKAGATAGGVSGHRREL